MSALPIEIPTADEVRLALALKHSDDPAEFIRHAYPWGQKGTALERHEGLDTWQSDVCATIKEAIAERSFPVLIARGSGHGIGKSAFMSMLMDWGLSTLVGTKAVLTANTESQLRTKTWPEIRKWFALSITQRVGAMWEVGETTIRSRNPNEPDWRLDRITWSETNSEAFAGLHNQGKRIIVAFDESSAISDRIWDVTEGALTDSDTELFWFVFGNITRASGRFRDCFGRFKTAWRARSIDSRTSRFTNKVLLESWRERYGEDSDFFRVRVKGEPPNQSVTQLIPSELVAAARRLSADGPLYTLGDPLVAGLDVARSGMNESVLAFRKGRDARSFAWCYWHDPDSMNLASNVVKTLRDMAVVGLRVRHLCVDGGGIGGPVCDRIRQIGLPAGCALHEVNFGTRLRDDRDYRDRGIQMWDRMRQRLERGMAIPDDPILEQQLVTRERFWTDDNRAFLESKDDMQERGLESPDRGDALALTEAEIWPSDDEARSMRSSASKEYRPLRIS